MAENLNGPGAAPGTGEAAAQALGLSAASRDKADAFLDDQRAMLHLQMEEMRQRNPYEISHFRLRRFSDWAKAALEFSLGLIAVAAVTGLGIAVWNAAHDDGLVIEAFSVPPGLAAQGLSGQVVASQMLDKLSGLQAGSAGASRAPSSYANNWDDDLKVEIPETGISIGEFNRYLHQTLGHQTHITGEVIRSGAGIAVTARFGTEAGPRFSGAETDLDALLQQAAEDIYGRTQPYRYGVYLQAQGKIADAEAFYATHTNIGSSTEQAWVYSGLYATQSAHGLVDEATRTARAAVAANPDVVFGWLRTAAITQSLGQLEATLAADRTAQRLLNGSVLKDLRPEAVTAQKGATSSFIAILLGAYADADKEFLARYRLNLSDEPIRQMQAIGAGAGTNLTNMIAIPIGFAGRLAREHDVAAARRVTAQAPGFRDAIEKILAARPDVRGQAVFDLAAQVFRSAQLDIAFETQDWARIRQLVPVMDAARAKLDAAYFSGGNYPPTNLWPLLAYAEARSGDFAAAHARVDRTPADCDLCLRMRGRIDAAQKNYDGAAFWFARAVQLAPSIPFAHEDWGQMLLERGQPGDAIAQFTLANKKGPHFADPLEGWGEALMAKNRSHLALAKFAEAEKYAPNWGRLHLKWGEALIYAGKTADAKAHFARAAALDLTPSEKSELARTPHG